MVETLKEALALLGLGPENILSLLYISLASTFIPQVLKRAIPSLRPELLAIVAGAVAGFVFLGASKGALTGFILGAFWTVAYKPVVRLLYKKWPELEDKLSASKKVVSKPDGSFEERDVTIPSAEGEKTILVEKPKEE